MTEKRKRWALAACAGLLFGASVQAQTLYRCGSQYQDQPCAGSPGKVVGSAGGYATVKPVSDAQCAQRGAKAQKIKWAREAGASAERQLADIDGKRLSASQYEEERKLIADVYSKQGSAPDVRAAIEADCVAEKEKAAPAEAFARALTPAQRDAIGASGKAPAGVANAADAKPGAARPAEHVLAHDGARAKTYCEQLKTRLERVRNEQRSGGAVAEMERLNQERRDLESEQRDEACR